MLVPTAIVQGIWGKRSVPEELVFVRKGQMHVWQEISGVTIFAEETLEAHVTFGIAI